MDISFAEKFPSINWHLLFKGGVRCGLPSDKLASLLDKLMKSGPTLILSFFFFFMMLWKYFLLHSMSLGLPEMLKIREGGECGDEELKLWIQILAELLNGCAI